MNFGLGLVLSFTDNASAGINNAVNSLTQLTSIAEGASQSLNQIASLSALSVVSDKLGSSLLSAGGRILGTFSDIVTGVQQTGTEFQSLRITLNALLKDEEKAENSLKKLMNFAATTPFEINDLTGIFTTITANGLDAFEQLQGATTGYQGSLISAIGDLMAFRPDVPAERWGVAIRNAFSGEVRSLKNALDLNVNDMLGRKWGSSGDIAQDFMDLADAIGVAGMMSNNFENNMNVQMANMSDIITKIKLAIADTGVFNILVQAIGNISKALQRIDGDRLDKLASSIGSAVQFILKPIIKISESLGNLIDKVVDFIGTHKGLTKILSVFVSLVGVALILGGVLLKLTSALSGLSLMMIASGKSFKSITKLFTSGIKTIIKKMLPLIALFALMRFAWKNDIAGVQTMTKKFVSNLSESFNTANKAVNGSVDDLISTMNDLNGKDDFFSNLTRGIIKVQMTMKALSDAWGDYTLSEENFKKAEELGILPLIERILDLKYRFGFFKKGFIEGWNEIGEKIKTFLGGIAKNIEGTFLEKIVDGFTKFFKLLTDNDPKSWEEAGKTFSKISVALIGLFGAFKLFKGISKIFGKDKGVGGLIGKLLGKKKGAGSSDGGGGLLSNPKNVLKTMGSIAIILGGVSLLVLALGALTSIPHFSDFVSNGAETISKIFSVIIPIAGSVGAIGLLIKALDLLKVDPMTALKGIANFAIILGGLELIMVAIGAISSIPSFSGFISKGADVIGKIADVLSKICDPKVLIAIGLISAFGLVPITVVLLGLANLALILAGITALIVAFGALSKIDGFNDFIKNGGDTLALLFEQIGKIAGSLIGGIGEGITNSLPVIGENLSNFAKKLTPFLDMVKNSPSATKITDFVKAFVNFLKEMVGEKSRSKKLKDLGDNFIDFSVNLNTMVREMGSSTNSITTFSNTFSSMRNNIQTGSTTLISSISNMVTSVSANLDKMSNKFKGLKFEFPKVKVPHFSITGDFDVETKKVPKVNVKWYETGGVFNKPSIIGVGENGQEAVMPLEKNIGWIGRLASMITSEMHSIVPTNTSQPISTTNQGDTNQNYMTRNTTNNHTIQGSTDNSVTFSEGAIQVFVQNATEEEARRLARKVMEYIKRQRQLDQMMNYG